MARIAGFTNQKDSKGKLTHVTINLKKHPQVLPLLQEMGVIEKSELQKMLDSDNWISVEKSRQKAHEKIDRLWEK